MSLYRFTVNMNSVPGRTPLWAILGLVAWQSYAADLAWLTDLPTAQAKANSEKKSVLLFFHGSDWCPPCVQMQRQLFDSAEFVAYARQALMLVDVDFPEKTKQPEELKRANLALKAKFNVGDGFPAIVLLNESGETVFQESGYGGGGPKEVLPNLQRHAKASSSAESARYKHLSVEEFATMANNKQTVLLDVRTKKEFEAGHLGGAVNLDVIASEFEQKAASLDRSKTYLVYCASGVRSAKACENLIRLNFLKLYDLPGGFKAWEKAGKPVEK